MVPSFSTGMAEADRRFDIMYRQRYDGLLGEGCLLRAYSLHGSVEQQDCQPRSFRQTRGQDDIHKRPGRLGGA